VETVRPLIDRKGQTLTLDLCPEPIEVEADAARLVQVVANLLNNAAKFTPDHGRITVTTEQAGPSATIRIRDTGVGIEPELLPRIFELFMQGGTSLDRAEGGLGIGLPLVRRLVEMHGGHVEARSAGLGQGSEFVVTWPRLPPARSAPPVAPPARPAPSRRRLRILLVEDDVVVADSFVFVLDLMGHEVRTAYTGHAALDLAPGFMPDVAFVDLGLPGIDGYEVARRLRQQAACRKTLLVALSGYGREEDKRRAREAGFAHHLTKPVDPATIEALLAERAGGGPGATASPQP
jgi:CheY-like chemotaxis protein